MKKKILFLIFLSAFILFQSLTVKAEEARFVEAEYIDDIYVNRIFSISKDIIYYQKARYFKKLNTNKFAYCIEPTTFFHYSANYTSVSRVPILSDQQITRIKALSHFGYQYQNHNEEKWYAITQLLIWREADPGGYYYFTDSLNGNRVERFQNEINELNSIVDNYIKQPNLSSNSITIREGQTVTITDYNNALNNYTTSLGTISNNNLIIENLKEGTYKVTLTKNDIAFNEPLTFYHSNDSQDIIMPGDYEEKLYINIDVVKTNLTINKVDKETKDSKGQGSAKIEGTIYKLYDDKEKEIMDITIDKEGKSIIEDIDFGNYYIKEYKPGDGYKLDDNKYNFTIDKENSKITLNLEDEIIKKEFTIHKTYGEESNFIGEKDIVFQIYDSNNKLVDTIKTNNDGYTNITLNYGKYKLVQFTSTEGYKMIDPIELTVEDEDKTIIELKDYKIAVPNTSTKESLRQKIIRFLLSLIC